MKVALLNPRFGKQIDYKIPLGLAYLSAVLEQNKIESIILYGEEYKTFEHFKRDLLRIKPDILGMNVISRNLDLAIEASRCAREVLPKIKIIFGGPHSSVMPLETINCPEVDIVCVGEGEYTLLEIAQGKPLKEIKGIFFKEGKKVVNTGPRDSVIDLDSLPPAARHKLKMNKHVKAMTRVPMRYPATTVNAARGCSWNCLFCQPVLKKIFGARTRYRNPKKVVDEMIYLKKKYKLASINVDDNELTGDRQWILSFCNELIRRKANIKWVCDSRVDQLDDELMAKLKKAGCYCLCFGVESGSQNTLNNYRKGITVKQIINAFRLCKKHKILAFAEVMMGGPEETEEDVRKTINLIKIIKPDYLNVSVTTPIIGTDLYMNAKRDNLLREETISNVERHNLSTMKRKYLPDSKLRKLVQEGFKTYTFEIIKIFVNPINWIKRGYTIKEILLFWLHLLKSPKLTFSAIKWYISVILIKNIKKGQRF